ncbi:DUF305 domain-containing protein [Candidatus Pacearchaeota archaeon]|nr:DUF305 domain-containing protein [Candidatus Pacearchaeota archaeon]
MKKPLIITLIAVAVLILVLIIYPSHNISDISHSMMNHPQITSEEIFIAEMIPHHQEAVSTSMLVLESENSEVKSLAEAIISAQEIEITMMQNWLKEWYPESNYKTTYKNMMPELNSLSGKDRDKAYLKGMIEHHQGAIQMAKQSQKLDLKPEVLTLTKNIISTQQAEVSQINQILKNL